MTRQELMSLPLYSRYEFTTYYGEKIFGYPVFKDDVCQIVTRTLNGDYKTSVLPAQLESCRPINDSDRSILRNNTSVKITGIHNFKTLIIVGAGASYDYSFDSSIQKPPLTTSLFDNDYIKDLKPYPGVENLSSQILQTKDIELFFQRQWDKVINSYNPILLSKIVDVQFYLHELFRQVSWTIDSRRNNYKSFFQALRDDLIDKGDNEKALVVSFNYDTILEQSLQQAFKYRFSTLDDYIDFSTKRFLLFKPHGSWNWVRQFDPVFLESIGIKESTAMKPINSIVYNKGVSLGTLLSKLSEETTVIDFQPSQLYHYPDLLIPFKSKDSYVMPDTHLLLLEHFIGSVEKIIVLGWKGAEEKFKELLKKHLGRKKLSVLYITARDKTAERELKDILPDAIFTEVAPNKDSKGTFTELNQFIQEHPERIFE